MLPFMKECVPDEVCMKNGIYLRLLEKIKAVLPEIPEDAVFIHPRRHPGQKAKKP